RKCLPCRDKCHNKVRTGTLHHSCFFNDCFYPQILSAEIFSCHTELFLWERLILQFRRLVHWRKPAMTLSLSLRSLHARAGVARKRNPPQFIKKPKSWACQFSRPPVLGVRKAAPCCINSIPMSSLSLHTGSFCRRRF